MTNQKLTRAYFSGNRWSKRSLDVLKDLHPDLQKVMNEALRLSEIDFGLYEGYRSPEKQNEYYQQGRTKPGKIITNVDGYNIKSNHNHKPALAVDVSFAMPFIPGAQRERIAEYNFAYLAGIVTTASKYLYEKREISQPVRWGGNWYDRGIVVYGYALPDMPHYELRK